MKKLSIPQLQLRSIFKSSIQCIFLLIRTNFLISGSENIHFQYFHEKSPKKGGRALKTANCKQPVLKVDLKFSCLRGPLQVDFYIYQISQTVLRNILLNLFSIFFSMAIKDAHVTHLKNFVNTYFFKLSQNPDCFPFDRMPFSPNLHITTSHFLHYN